MLTSRATAFEVLKRACLQSDGREKHSCRQQRELLAHAP
jgi:hypothetical protein